MGSDDGSGPAEHEAIFTLYGKCERLIKHKKVHSLTENCHLNETLLKIKTPNRTKKELYILEAVEILNLRSYCVELMSHNAVDL